MSEAGIELRGLCAASSTQVHMHPKCASYTCVLCLYIPHLHALCQDVYINNAHDIYTDIACAHVRYLCISVYTINSVWTNIHASYMHTKHTEHLYTTQMLATHNTHMWVPDMLHTCLVNTYAHSLYRAHMYTIHLFLWNWSY